MANNPLAKLARLVGGTAMLPGRLGHQVLGQLLISGSTSLEVAGASVALSAVARQRSAAAQIAVRTVAPAAVVEALSRKEARRLERLNLELARQQQDLAVQSHRVRRERERLQEASRELETQQSLHAALQQELLALRRQNEELGREVEALRSHRLKNALVETNNEAQAQNAARTAAPAKAKAVVQTEVRSSQTKPKVDGLKQSLPRKRKATNTRKKSATGTQQKDLTSKKKRGSSSKE
ncbi:MAG: hypothetical protein PVG22_05295 [Chromatiales bacterium]|jgi:hypothetical protein